MSTTTTELNLENVSYAKKGAIAYVTLNRPKVLNALNTKTWQDLKAAFEDARDDDAVRGVILTGARRQSIHRRRRHQRTRQDHCRRSGKIERVWTSCSRSCRESRQTCNRRGKRLRAWRRVRDGHGLHDQDCR